MPKIKTETTDDKKKKKVGPPTRARWFTNMDAFMEAQEELAKRVARLGPRALRKQK